MYPLPVVLVGVNEILSRDLRREFACAEADVESEFQSAFMAIDCLRYYPKQPRLVIVEMSDDCDVETIERLGISLCGWPILALVRSESGEDFLRVNRAGAVQVVPLPLDSEDLHRALSVIGSQFDQKALERQVVGVIGAVGGIGTTTIAVNLASEIAERFSKSTILAELTLQMGALAPMLNLEPRMTLPHLIREIHRVDSFLLEKTLVPVTERLRILAGAQSHNSVPFVEPDHMVKIVGYLRKLAAVTVLDLPGTFDDLEFQVLKACDQVVVVAAQSVPAIRSLKSFCESLPEDRLVHSLWVVLNRYEPAMKGFSCEDIKQLLGVARVFPIAGDFPAVKIALNQGGLLRQVAPATPILRDIDRLIHEILGLDHEKGLTNGRGLFSRFLHALSR
jgi:pilus assembly protein CpaE